MYNQTKASQDAMPSSAQLLRSTVAAIVVALAILVTMVLPAEYAIDPTGIGRALGLQNMGEVKAQLAAEAVDEPIESVSGGSGNQEILERLERIEATLAGLSAAQVVPAAAAPAEPAVKTETMSLTLAPNQGAEIKVEMAEGAIIEYEWLTDGGKINFDTHGDPYNAPRDFYHGYSKGLFVPGDQGQLEAAFDGYHGWFWRNRTPADIEVTLIVKGEFASIKRML